MTDQPAVPESELEKKRRGVRERVQRFRLRQKEKEGRSPAQLALVDCPEEVTIKEARRILTEERGFQNLHAVEVCIALLKTASENLKLPFNQHLVRFGVQQTRLELEWKRLVREKFSSSVVGDEAFEYFVHEQAPELLQARLAEKEANRQATADEIQSSTASPVSAEEKKDVGLL